MEGNKPLWAKRISLEGEELEDNRRYNSNKSIHWEWIHPDRFRYHHEINDGKKKRKFSCGGKYDPDDVSECVFCQGHKYGRSEKEVLDVANGTFGYPNSYNKREVFVDWSEGREATRISRINNLW